MFMERRKKYLLLFVVSAWLVSFLFFYPAIQTFSQADPNNQQISQLDTEAWAYLPLIHTPLITAYSAADGGVTIKVPEGNRYIIIGDSLGYGSQFLGQNTFEDICVDRWPFSQQLSAETGILSTAGLDRGHSILSPFLVQIVDGHVVEYCNPAPEEPKTNTVVPGSFTSEWLTTLRFDPVVQAELSNPDNPVVLILIGADIFANKIDKPVVSPDEYMQNLGQLVAYFATFDKVTYIAHFPHVRAGSFIAPGEIGSYNTMIDLFNQRIDEMVAANGYTDPGTNQFVDFGQKIIEQDGLRLWVNFTQPGPDLDQVSDTFTDDYYAKDGLHYHAAGYDTFGSAWAASLKAAIKVNQAEWLP